MIYTLKLYSSITNNNTAMQSEKIQLILFYMDDCSWCEWVKSEVIEWMIPAYEYSYINFLYINGKDMRSEIYAGNKSGFDIAEEYGVFLFPTVIINYNNTTQARITGVASKDNYWSSLDVTLDQIKN